MTTKPERMVAKTPNQLTANTASLLWVLQPDDMQKRRLLEILATEVLALLAMGWADEDGDDTPYIGITDMAIETLCERIGFDRAAAMCDVQ